MKAKIQQGEYGVSLFYDDPVFGERIHRYFSCPTDGGYVYEVNGQGIAEIICDYLSNRGDGLISRSRKDLIKVIRKEWRKLRRYHNNTK